MRYSFRSALISGVAAAIICVAAASVAAVRNCGISGDSETAGAAVFVVLMGRNAIIAFVVACFLFGGWKPIADRLLYFLATLLVIAVAAVIMLTPPYQGPCTPI